MKKRASFRLSIVMIILALLISFTIATIDYFELKDQNIKSNEFHKLNVPWKASFQKFHFLLGKWL